MPIRLNLTDVPAEEPRTEPENRSSGSRTATVEAPLDDLSSGESELAGNGDASSGSGSLPAFRRSRYEDLDPTDLLHIID